MPGHPAVAPDDAPDVPPVHAGRKALLVILANVLGAVGGYAVLLLVGRYFEPSAYGSYLFAVSVGGIFSLLTNLGLGAAHQRHVAQGLDPARAIGVLLRIRLLLGAAVLALFAGLALAWSSRGEALTDATTVAVLVVAFGVQVLSSARQLFLDTWQGQQRVHRVESVKLLDTVLLVVLLGNAALLIAHLSGRWEAVPGLGAFWAGLLGWTTAPSVEEAALLLASCYASAKVATFLVAWGWALKDRLAVGPWDRTLARSYVRMALPLALAGALAMVLQATDSIMLGYFWTAQEVGWYGAAQRLSSLGLLGTLAVGTVLFPRFAQLHAVGDRAGELATFRKADRYMLLVVAPVAAAMVALPEQGLHVAVGDSYAPAAWPLRLLAAWALVTTMAYALASWFMGAGRMRVVVRAATVNAIGNVALNAFLIPEAGFGLGPSGAALATGLSTLASYVYLRAVGRRLHGLPWVTWSQVRILLAGGIAGAFWVAVLQAIGPDGFDRFWELGGWGLAGLAIYALALAAFRELGRRDLEFVRRVASPDSLWAELRGR